MNRRKRVEAEAPFQFGWFTKRNFGGQIGNLPYPAILGW